MNDRLSAAPHQFRALTVVGFYTRLLLAALVAVAPGLLRDGGVRLPVALAAVVFAIGLQWGRAAIGNRTLRTSEVLRTGYYGVFVAALVPYGASIGVVALATLVCIALGYWAPGGVGQFWIHPAIVGLAFAYLLTGIDTVGDVAVAAPHVGPGLGARLNAVLLNPLSIRVGEGFWERFVGLTRPASPAGHLLPVLAASLIVYGEDLAPPQAALGALLGHGVVSWLVGGLPSQLWAGAPFTGLVGGNVAFLIVFALAEPGVRPTRSGAALWFGLITGSISAGLHASGATAWPTIVAFLLAGSLSRLFDRTGRYR